MLRGTAMPLLAYFLKLAVCWLVIIQKGSEAGDAGLCPKGYFYNISLRQCKRCSTSCPEDLIYLPCSEFGDVLCEKLPLSSDLPGSNKPSQNHRGGSFVQSHIDTSQDGGTGDEQNEESELELTMEKNDWRYWKTLAFTLIALLSALIIVATIVVVVACLKLQQALITKQQEEADIDDADSGYVVIRTIRDMGPHTANPDQSFYTSEELLNHPPLLASQDTAPGGSTERPSFSSSSPQSLCFLPRTYTPQRRLLTYDADEVFESDDQGHRPVVNVQNSSPPQAATGSDGHQARRNVWSVPSALDDSKISPSRKQKKNWCRKKRKARNLPEEDADSGFGCFGS